MAVAIAEDGDGDGWCDGGRRLRYALFHVILTRSL